MIKKLAISALLLVSSAFAKEVVLETTEGNITLNLFEDVAPKAVENFVTHAKNGYYDGLTFHRVIKGFMMQGGDPTGTGMGGESIWGKDFEDEFHRNVLFDKPGVLAMANAGPNTNGSQFFITFGSASWLNAKHTIFGEVTAGMNTLKKIENAKTDQRDKPLQDIKIIKAIVNE